MQHTEAGNDMNGLGAAQHLLDQVIAARAAELARRGAYAEAEALLGGLLDSEQAAPQTLDLGARIAAQTGRYARARELWQRASALAPGEPAYQAALERLALAERPPRQPRRWLVWCGAAACLVLVLVIVWTAGRGQAAGEAYAPTSMPTLVASATVAPTPLPTAAASPTAAALVVELTPAEIAQSRLEQEPLLLGGQVYAASRQGVLLLYGQVPNDDAYQAAIAIAKAVPGVSEVDAEALRIAAPALAGAVERLAAQFPDLAFAVEGSSVRISGSTTKTELQQVTAALAQVAYIGYIDASAVTLRAGYYLYAVQPDDSLAGIAERELGDGEAWELLAFINRDQIADPDVIYPGMQLKIPQ